MGTVTIEKSFIKNDLVVIEETITIKLLYGQDGENGFQNHSQLNLDDGTNPHGTTFPDVDDGFVAKTNEENEFTAHQKITDAKWTFKSAQGYTEVSQAGNNFTFNMYSSIAVLLRSFTFNTNGLLPGINTNLSLGFNNASLKWKELWLSSFANVLGVKSPTNSATEIFTTDGNEVTLPTGVTNEEENTINTELEAGMTGEDLVLNVLSLTQVEYDAGTKTPTTFYIITD